MLQSMLSMADIYTPNVVMHDNLDNYSLLLLLLLALSAISLLVYLYNKPQRRILRSLTRQHINTRTAAHKLRKLTQDKALHLGLDQLRFSSSEPSINDLIELMTFHRDKN